MVVDVELTLNRWGLGRVGTNKIQIGCLRFSAWRNLPKWALSFEVNWACERSSGERCHKCRSAMYLAGGGTRGSMVNGTEKETGSEFIWRCPKCQSKKFTSVTFGT